MAILAQALGKTIPETGTTTFRPNYTPVTFGTFAGRELGDLFEPVRKTAMHDWHVENGARVRGRRPVEASLVLPEGGRRHARGGRARMRSRCASSVGMLDASTLGKIDIQGPDAREFLNRVYTNACGASSQSASAATA